MVRFDKLPALPDLPPPAELIDRNVPSEALKRYLAGAAMAENYRDADAIPEFEAAIAADPAGFEPRLALGRAALREGDLAKAQEALEAAVKQRPRSAEVHYLLGLVAAGRNDAQAALRQLRYALALADDDGQRLRIYFHLAQVLERLDYCQAAIEIAGRFEAIIRGDMSQLPLQPQWRDLLSSQGWRIPSTRAACLRRMGQFQQAVEAYDVSLRMAPDNTEVMLQQAETLIDAGDTRRAAEVADKVMSKEPTNVSGLAMLAATLAVDDRYTELRQRLLTLVRQNPSDLLLAQRVASIFLKFNQLDAALQALLIARKSISEPGPIYAALLQIVLANEDLSSAVNGLAGLLSQMEPAERDLLLEPIDALQVNPKLAQDVSADGQAVLASIGADGTKLLALGVIAGASRQPVLAERALRAALAAQPDSLLVVVSLGEQLLAQCRWQEAIALVEPLKGKFAESGAIYRILGTAYDGLDDFKLAMTSFYEALRKDRKDAKAMWMAAQINDRLGQPEQASSIYQVLVTIRPDAWQAHVALVKSLLAVRKKDAAVQHAGRLKEAFPAEAAADLCVLIAQSGDAVPPSSRIEVLLKTHPRDRILRLALGEAHLAEGKPEGASDVLVGVLADDPANEDARLLLTTALARQLRIDLAVEVLQSLLAEHPNRILWRFAYAELLAQAGQPQAAADILSELLKTPWGREQRSTLLNRLAFFLEYAGQHQRTIDLLEEELKASPDDRAIQAQLLGVLENQGKRAEAIERLRSWRKGAPDDALLRRLEAQFLRAMDADEAAAAEILSDWPSGKGPSGKDLPPRQPGQLAVHDQDVALLAAAMPPAQAAEWLASRAWLGPIEVSAPSLAEEAAQRGEYREAVELDRLAGRSDESLARQTQWTFLAGERGRAELVLMPQVQRNAEMSNRLDRLRATFYKRMGLNDLAVRQTEAVYARYKGTERAGEAANDLAYVYAELGMNLALAEPLAIQAVASDGTSAAYMDTLAWVYYQQGRFSEALRWIRQAVRVPGQGDDPVLQDHLGDICWRGGQRDAAIEAWRKARDLYVQELKTDRLRPDLAQGLEGVTAKIAAVESRKPPPVAAWAGQRSKS
jgi:tetratricopeptide (TPR) repeat protein